MKYKLTKEAWQDIGRQAGWMGDFVGDIGSAVMPKTMLKNALIKLKEFVAGNRPYSRDELKGWTSEINKYAATLDKIGEKIDPNNTLEWHYVYNNILWLEELYPKSFEQGDSWNQPGALGRYLEGIEKSMNSREAEFQKAVDKTLSLLENFNDGQEQGQEQGQNI